MYLMREACMLVEFAQFFAFLRIKKDGEEEERKSIIGLAYKD